MLVKVDKEGVSVNFDIVLHHLVAVDLHLVPKKSGRI